MFAPFHEEGQNQYEQGNDNQPDCPSPHRRNRQRDYYEIRHFNLLSKIIGFYKLIRAQ
jgi:hypothetical protein